MEQGSRRAQDPGVPSRVAAGLAAMAIVAAVGALLRISGPATLATPSPEPEAEVAATEADVASGGLPVLWKPTGTRLWLTSDATLTMVDVDAGRDTTVELDELAADDSPYRLEARGQTLVFHGDQGTYAQRAELGAEPRLLGRSSYFLPSSHPQRVWLVTWRKEPTGRLAAVQEVTAGGTPTSAAVLSPQGGRPSMALDSGLVLRTPRGLQVWDPAAGRFVPVSGQFTRTGEASSTLPGRFPVAASGNLLAWCRLHCLTLRLADLGTGERFVGAPAGTNGFGGSRGAFSPDGRWLALPAVPADGLADSDIALALVDVAAGTASLVPGGGMHGERLAWSPSGDWVFFQPRAGELAAYRPGDGSAMAVPVEVGGFFGIAATR
ncbi:MAG: hypothetical protein M3415_08655 [Actinomycetota bacterium]|jgi:hypothetical protein|nr:hypothetical protein [Actinomycetota bacterium]